MDVDSSVFVAISFALKTITLARDLERAYIVLLLMVATDTRMSKESPRLCCTLAWMFALAVDYLSTGAFEVKPASTVVNLLVMPMPARISWNSAFALSQMRLRRGLFLNFKYLEFMRPVALMWAYNCVNLVALLMGNLPSSVRFWQSPVFFG